MSKYKTSEGNNSDASASFCTLAFEPFVALKMLVPFVRDVGGAKELPDFAFFHCIF